MGGLPPYRYGCLAGLRPPWRRYAVRPGGVVGGAELFADGKLQTLLETWQQTGEHFTGFILITRGEKREERYDPENDVWVTKKSIEGDGGLIFKTERQGTLLIQLTEKGFHWSRGDSCRFSN